MVKTKTNTNLFLQKRFVFMGGIEGMSFKPEDFEGIKEKKEVAQKEPLKVEDLVKRSNDLLKTHESRLKEFPPRFQDALHDEMVQFFRTSADRFDQNREQGMNAIEFEKYGQAMLEKLHQILEKYAPVEEKSKEKKEDAEEKLDDLMEKPEPELENVIFDPSKLGTVEGIQTELKKYGQRGAELIEQGHGLSLKIERFQDAYQQYLNEKKGWPMFTRKFWKDEETEKFQQKLDDFKKDLEARLKVLETKKKDLAEYARNHLNSAGDRLRYAQITERERLINQVGNDPEKAKKIESHYAEILEKIDKVDALVADRVLDLNLQTELLISELEGQKAHYNEFKIDAPNVWDATVGLLFNRIGDGWRKMLVNGLSETVLDGTSEWLQEKTKGIPVIETGTKIITNIIFGLPSGVIEGTGELIHGTTTLLEHPIDTLKGISTLLPVYNGTNGKWFDFASAGRSWKEMGKAIIAYDTFAEGNVGKGTSKAALNVLLLFTGVGALSKGAQGAKIAYFVSRTEAGVLKSSLKATTTATIIFVSDYSKEVAKIPGKVIAAPGRLIETLPNLSALKPELSNIAKLRLEIAKANERLAQANERLKNMALGGKNASEIKALNGKSSKELDAFTSEDFKELGLNGRKPIEEFLAFKDGLKTVEKLAKEVEKLKFQERAAQISPELLQLSSLDGSKLDEFISKFNAAHPEGFKDKVFTIVKRGEREVVALDETGKLKKYVINEETAKSVLAEIKKADPAPREGISSYELRRECVQRSEISTHEAYTYGEVPKSGKEMWEYLRDPNHWLPERRAFHNKIFHQESDAALQLSERLGDADPTMHLLRGNTGSGKSHYLRNNEPFRRAINEEGKVPGVMNPDNYKKRILEHEIAEGGKPLTSDQVFREAHAIMDRVVDDVRIRNPNVSEVWDQRFAKFRDIMEKLADAKKQGKKISIIDLDTPLETSCLRVLNRKQISSAPRTNFEVVADGYAKIRNERKTIINFVKKDATIKDYILYATDNKGRMIKVYEKRDGIVQAAIGEVEKKIYEEVAEKVPTTEVESVRNKSITTNYTNSLPPELKQGAQQYLRDPPITLEQALNEHASFHQ